MRRYRGRMGGALGQKIIFCTCLRTASPTGEVRLVSLVGVVRFRHRAAPARQVSGGHQAVAPPLFGSGSNRWHSSYCFRRNPTGSRQQAGLQRGTGGKGQQEPEFPDPAPP